MPITLPNGSTYKLCLLDTNALSEIVKYPKNEGRGFVESFSPKEFVPCFTAYNLIELRRQSDVYNKFIEFFSVYPSLIMKPFQLILQKEVEANGRAGINEILFNVFTPLDNKPFQLSDFIDKVFGNEEMARLEGKWIKEEQEILNYWQKTKANFIPQNPIANAKDAQEFVEIASINALSHMYPKLVQESINAKDIDRLLIYPSMQVMLYGQYYRTFAPGWIPKHQEVTDVYISACAPYVDAIVTEKFQAEIYKKIQKYVGMSVRIAKLRDIRHHK